MKLAIMMRIAVKYEVARFEFLTAVLLKVEVFGMLCRVNWNSCLYFEGQYCLYFQGQTVQLPLFLDPLRWKMKLLLTFQRPVAVYQ
jgi:hypothetical protein